jgi:hypothetical protein
MVQVKVSGEKGRNEGNPQMHWTKKEEGNKVTGRDRRCTGRDRTFEERSNTTMNSSPPRTPPRSPQTVDEEETPQYNAGANSPSRSIDKAA